MDDMKFFPCGCFSHAIGVWKDDDEEFTEPAANTLIYISWWERPYKRDDWIHRIKGAWKFLMGDPWKDDVVMDKENLKKFVDYLQTLL